jgi:hypothetical protein
MGVSKPRSLLREWLVSGVTPLPTGMAGSGELLEEARRQGLVGLLASEPFFLDRQPKEIREAWREDARRLLVRGVVQLDLAGRVLRRLEVAGLRALPLKGAAVAESLYDSAGERPMSDIDVLVLDDAARAERLLGEEGLSVAERADHAVALRQAKTGAVVELHRSVTSCPGLFPCDAEGLLARRVPGGGTVPFVPSPPDLLVSLALHAAFQNGLGLTFVQFLDFRRVFERLRVDEICVLETARAARAEGVVLVALTAARAVVGAAPPPGLLAALEAHAPFPARRLARAVETGDPLRLVAPERPSLARTRWALAGGRRLELLRRTVFPLTWPGQPPRGGLGTFAHGLSRAGRLVTRELARVPVPEPKGP